MGPVKASEGLMDAPNKVAIELDLLLKQLSFS